MSRLERVRRLAIAASALALYLAVSASPATAGTFVYAPCADSSSSGSPMPFGTGTMWKACPQFVRIDTAATPPGQMSEAVLWPMRAGVVIQGVRATAWGSDGSDVGTAQGIYACPISSDGSGCSSLLTPAGQNASEQVVEAAGVSPNAALLTAMTHCTRTKRECPASMPAYFRDIRITAADNSPPFYGDREFGDLPNGVLDGWSSTFVQLPAFMDFYDSEAGLKQYRVLLNGWQLQRIELCQSIAGVGYPKLCPPVHVLNSGADYVPISFPGTTLPQGPGTLALEIQDAASNITSVSRPVKIDSIAPDGPRDLRANARADGWVDGTSLDLTWRNAGESQTTPTQSGVWEARWAVYRPDDTVSVARGTEYGEGIERVDDVSVPSDGLWTVRVGTVDRAGNVSAVQDSLTIGVDSTVPAEPVLTAPTVVNARELADASQSVSWMPPANDAQLESGICGYDIAYSADPEHDPGSGKLIVPLVDELPLPSSLPDGEVTVHLRATSCAGVPGAIARRSITVDRTAPAVSVTEAGGAWWTAGDSPVITASDSGTGVAAISYSVDGGVATEIESATATLDLTPGEHVVAFHARDIAGNESAPQITRVAIDREAPKAVFEQHDPLRPTVVRAVVADEASGIVDAWFELRPVGVGAWRPFDNRFTATTPALGSVALAARFPETALPSGEYEMRVVAIDAAGHTTVATTRADGIVVHFSTTMRRPVILSAGIKPVVQQRACKRERRRTCKKQAVRPRSIATLGYGQRSEIEGLLSSDGTPLAGMPLELSTVGDPAGKRYGVTTDASGRFTAKIAAGVSRRILVRFTGSETHTPAQAGVEVRVRPAVRLIVSRSRVRRGSQMRATVVLPVPRSQIPRAGKLVELQCRCGGRWTELAERRTDERGRAVFRMPLAGASTPLRYRLRAHVPEEGDLWPYFAGESDPVSVLVLP